MGLLQGVWSVVKGCTTPISNMFAGLVLKSPMFVSKNPTSCQSSIPKTAPPTIASISQTMATEEPRTARVSWTL